MVEQRQFNRWCVERDEKAIISYAGSREEVKILDISTGGMKVSVARPLNVGATIYGEFKILPQIGAFFVRGRVLRVAEGNHSFEVSVTFEKVSSMPLQVQ